MFVISGPLVALLSSFVLLFLGIVAFRLLTPTRLDLTPRVGDYFAESLAQWFHRYQIGVTAEEDTCWEDLQWKTYLCINAEALQSFLNDEDNDGWEVYQITPLGGTGKFVLVMNAPRDIDEYEDGEEITDDDDAYGEPEDVATVADETDEEAIAYKPSPSVASAFAAPAPFIDNLHPERYVDRGPNC